MPDIPSPASAIPVIIDTDPGVDDSLALLLAAASPELEVLAVTTVGGNTGLERVTENARCILGVAWEGRTPPPVYRGVAGHSATAEEVHGIDGLGGATLVKDRDTDIPCYRPGPEPQVEPAVETIPRLARERPGEITLVTLGPLTNIAAALAHDLEGMRQLRKIVVMGGAFRECGNITPCAEFNIQVDPEAAQAVCESGIPILWVPTDVTHQCVLLPEHLEGLPDTLRTRFLRDVLPFNFEFHRRSAGYLGTYMHDPLALAVAAWPDLVRTTPLRVDVETEGRFTRGMTVADLRGYSFDAVPPPNADVALEVDSERFLRLFGERMREG